MRRRMQSPPRADEAVWAVFGCSAWARRQWGERTACWVVLIPVAIYPALVACQDPSHTEPAFDPVLRDESPEEVRLAQEVLPDADTGVEEDHPLAMKAGLSHAAYGRSGPDRLTLKIDLVGSLDAASVLRPALNLALVIDCSGSMGQEHKFEYAMQAARLVVENLTRRDTISLVAFNQRALVLSSGAPAVNRTFLDHRLDEVHPEGWTNLSAGLLEAIAQVESQRRDEQKIRLIVLTDGQANRGVTSPEELRRMVRSARDRGIGVSTLGCGDSFDEKLLSALSDAGGGRYTYVRSPEEIPAAISAELDGLLRAVAQNVTLEGV